ncbi:MAG: hypothetical protein J07HQW1_01021 [Haloquadratum walsbyi J07HQW1]|uniref:Uncharacterized protein n=1 Tax=Haloquadratum walsbyi J07HQW1 TaxID=1238424 RepID=U1N387_9EURY|nr:MAG: hypothetical protein J07HQW1_01021 [Haloquadratum walsbyi J07HQW1]
MVTTDVPAKSVSENGGNAQAEYLLRGILAERRRQYRLHPD